MKLPDFSAFEPFLKLRKKMGADKLGHFEFFDPQAHLTVDERNQLESGFLSQLQSVRVLTDFTLAYKNSRVAVALPTPRQPEEWLYHLAACNGFAALAHSDGQRQVILSTTQPQAEMGSYRVCGECLQRLRYQGFDGMRNRHRQYSLRVQEEFDLSEFFKAFPVYPVIDSEESLPIWDMVQDSQ